MKIKLCYKNSIINLPAENILPQLSTATREELAVLLSVAAESDFDVRDLASRLNITENSLLSAVSKWVRIGVIAVSEASSEGPKADNSRKNSEKPADNAKTSASFTSAIAESNSSADTAVSKPSVRVSGPKAAYSKYSSSDVADYLEANPSVAQLINDCQSIFGKLFSPSETAIVVSLIDQLRLDSQYVLLIFAYAAKIEKKGVRYVEKMVTDFYDNGITTYDELNAELDRREKAQTAEGVVRRLFGIGERAFTPTEKEKIYLWTNTYHYGEDIISHAYSITVDKTSNASMPYCGKILENWYNAGCRTLDDILQAEAKYKADKEANSSDGGSFDTDEFFEMALRRSYSNTGK